MPLFPHESSLNHPKAFGKKGASLTVQTKVRIHWIEDPEAVHCNLRTYIGSRIHKLFGPY
jgi:hypothetical protein